MKTLKLTTLVLSLLYLQDLANAQVPARQDAGNITPGTWLTKLGFNASNPLQFSTIELGNASDTTIARSSAGVMSVEGVIIPSLSSSGAFTNKTYNGLTITTSSGTLTVANSKALTVSNTLTLQGTDGSTLIIGGGGTLGTAAYTAASAYEAALGNPDSNGYILSSTTGGTRTWIAPGGNLTSGPVTSSGGVSAIANNALSTAMTSGLQTALDAKANLAGADFTGPVTATASTGAVGIDVISSNLPGIKSTSAGGTAASFASTNGYGATISSVGDTGCILSSIYSTGALIYSTTGVGSSIYSSSGTGARIYSFTGTGAGIISYGSGAEDRHATFGETGIDQSFVARVKGSFGWIRGAFTGRIHPPDTLAANRTWTLPDASGTVALEDVSNSATVTTINGRIAAGTNITLSGAGTAASPYSISASGGNLTSGPVTSSGGVSAIASAQITNAMLAGSIDLASKVSGILPQTNIAAMTGDVTKPSGSGVTTLASIPAISGANLTTLNASQLTIGTLPTASSVSVQTVASDNDATIAAGVREVFISPVFASVPRVLTLPAANSCPAGSSISFIRSSGSTGQDGLITRAGSDKISGSTSPVTIASGDEPVYLYSNGVSNWTVGKKGVTGGGTGITSYAVGDILYASGTATLSKLADVATGSVLVSGGVGFAPAWSSAPTLSGSNMTNLPGANITGNIPVARIATALVTPGPIGGGTPSTGAFTTLTASGASTLSGGIVGTTTNNNATALTVGEYVSNAVVQGSATALTTATPKTVTSISLTAGDWDVTGIGAITGASTGTSFDVAVGTTNNMFTGTVLGDSRCQTPTVSLTGADATLMIPAVRVSIASTTTVYLIVQETFTVGSPGAYGKLSARRVR